MLSVVPQEAECLLTVATAYSFCCKVKHMVASLSSLYNCNLLIFWTVFLSYKLLGTATSYLKVMYVLLTLHGCVSVCMCV